MILYNNKFTILLFFCSISISDKQKKSDYLQQQKEFGCNGNCKFSVSGKFF